MRGHAHAIIGCLVATGTAFKSTYMELDGAEPTWSDRKTDACVFGSYSEACDRVVLLKKAHPDAHYFPITCSLTEEQIHARRHRAIVRAGVAMHSAKQAEEELREYEENLTE